MGPHMRNYIRGSYGFVTYSFPPPTYPNSLTQYFLTGDEEATQSQMQDFVSLLDPSNYQINQVELLGDIFFLIDKDLFISTMQIVPGWWTFVGTDRATTESPRKSWSHGH